MKKVLVVVCSLLLLVAAGACKKKQEQTVPQPSMPGSQQLPSGHPGVAPGGAGAPGTPGAPGNVVMPAGVTTVTVPASVKGKWKGVVLVVQDKATGKSSEYTVNLNSDFKIPNSNLTVSVGEFLPDFKMNGLEITSTSNEPNNPAVGIKVLEDGKQIFPAPGKKWGWLYIKFPTMHPFEHGKYAIVLKEGIKKG